MQLELQIDQLFYMSNKLSQKAGAKVVIHNPRDYPMPEEFGIDLHPGTSSSVALQMVIDV